MTGCAQLAAIGSGASGVVAPVTWFLFTVDLLSGQSRAGLSCFHRSDRSPARRDGREVRSARSSRYDRRRFIPCVSGRIGNATSSEFIEGRPLVPDPAIVVRSHLFGQSGAGSRSP
jgi:hypothetical protein